jgi:hypothetical protein
MRQRRKAEELTDGTSLLTGRLGQRVVDIQHYGSIMQSIDNMKSQKPGAPASIG